MLGTAVAKQLLGKYQLTGANPGGFEKIYTKVIFADNLFHLPLL